MEDRFSELSKRSHFLMKTGKWCDLVLCLEEMSKVLHGEEKYTDELKLLMLASYITLGKDGVLSKEVAAAVKTAIDKLNLTCDEMFVMYSSIVPDGDSPFGRLSLQDSFNLFKNAVNCYRQDM